jgi:hypothetical protein
MHKKILAICAALMAFAVMPAAALATNSPQLVEGGTAVATGTLIQATNVGNTVMTDASGNTLLSCESATLTGSVTKNDGSNVEGNVTAASFNNVGSETCTGSIGATKVTPNPATNGLPWCLRSTSTMATHEFQLRGNECSKASRAIRFVLDLPFNIVCTYQRAAAVQGTYTTGAGTTTLSISKQEFPLFEGGFGCPSVGYLDMTFKLETDGTNTGLDLI